MGATITPLLDFVVFALPNNTVTGFIDFTGCVA